jgi:uncharacterized protein
MAESYLPSIGNTPYAVNLTARHLRLNEMLNRPLLTAQLRKLLFLNFPIPTDVITRLVPPGTEPDLYDGQSYISVIGFLFQNVRFLGLAFPGHTNFPEINLRYYVRRIVGGEIRRGVVFVRKIAPRSAVAIVANCLFSEKYITRSMRSEIQMSGDELAPGDSIEHTWKSHSRHVATPAAPRTRWNRLFARVAAPLNHPRPGSLEQFIAEHYWGDIRGRDGRTNEYRVTHALWPVAPADNVIWDCDLPATYDTPLAEYLAAPPTTAFIAEGSAIQLFRGRAC